MLPPWANRCGKDDGSHSSVPTPAEKPPPSLAGRCSRRAFLRTPRFSAHAADQNRAELSPLSLSPPARAHRERGFGGEETGGRAA